MNENKTDNDNLPEIEFIIQSTCEYYDDLRKETTVLSIEETEKYIKEKLQDLSLEESNTPFEKTKKEIQIKVVFNYIYNIRHKIKAMTSEDAKEYIKKELIKKRRESSDAILKEENVSDIDKHIEKVLSDELECLPIKVTKDTQPDKPPPPKEQHTDIFVNSGYKLFDYIWNNYISGEKGQTEQVSYYYRKMSTNPKYIHANHEDFKTWLLNNSGYNFSISTIKTLENTKNSDRDRNYSNSLKCFNLET